MKREHENGYNEIRKSRRKRNEDDKYPVKQTADFSHVKPDRRRNRLRRGLRRRVLIVLFVLELVIFLPGIFCARYVLNKINLISSNSKKMEETNPNLADQTLQNLKGYWTVALFGMDSRDGNVDAGNNSNVMMIFSINRASGQIRLVSVFRDSYLSVNDKGAYRKIDSSYCLGGPDQAISALDKNLDIQIDNYITFNWKSVADAINILGGVDVDINDAELYYINSYITETVKSTGVGSYQLKHTGPQHLDGVQAVAYARLRKMDTDFARTERQRDVLLKCIDKLKTSKFSVVNNVLNAVISQINTDITFGDLISVAKNMSHYNIEKTIGFPMERTTKVMKGKGDCVIPQTLETNVVKLHEFLYDDENYQPSDAVKKISAKISADTGMYKEGTYIDHVGTDKGVVPKKKAAPKKGTVSKHHSTANKTSAAVIETTGGETAAQKSGEANAPSGGKAETKEEKGGKLPAAGSTDSARQPSGGNGNPSDGAQAIGPGAGNSPEPDSGGKSSQTYSSGGYVPEGPASQEPSIGGSL